LRFDTTGKGIIFGIEGGSDRPSIVGNYTSSTNNNIAFNTTGSERMRIDSSGRLLIGHSTGNGFQTLSVSGNTGGSSGAGMLFLRRGLDRATIGTNVGADLGEVDFGDLDGNVYASIQGKTDAATGSNDFPGRIILATTADGGSSPSERMRIDSSGRVGIGDTSPDAPLVVRGTASVPHTIFKVNSNSESTKFSVQTVQDSDIRIGTQSNHPLGLYTNQLERMRIDTSGKVGIGTTIQDHLLHVKGSSAVLKIDHTSTGDTKGVVMRHARGGLSGFTGKMISFIGNDNTEEGSIVIGTTATAFNTSSDYRLKENEVAISDGITRLKQLKPYIFNFKKDPDTTVDGFFAHEVQSVVPEAITGTKDEVDSDNNPVYQGIDQSKLVPLLVAALQEEISKRESLETRVAALEAA
jgi:hypothetical protein